MKLLYAHIHDQFLWRTVCNWLDKDTERLLSAAGRCVSAQSGEERQSPGGGQAAPAAIGWVQSVHVTTKCLMTDSVNQTVLIIGRKLVYSQVAVGTLERDFTAFISPEVCVIS